jgi:pSer/pThr/pTyr-binding forkhead associated (FHA) protein
MAAQYTLRKTSTGAEVELRPTMVVGKLETCDIVLKEGLPSRRHALLAIENDMLYVNDEGSSNGTFVNGTRITARTVLKNGDKVRFDAEEFTVGGAPAAGSDDGKTVMRRPPPTPDPPPRAAAPVAPAPAAPVPAAPAPAAPAAPREEKRPPAWIDAANQVGGDGSKTVMFGRKELHAQVTADSGAVAHDVERVAVPTLLVKSGAAVGRRFELHAARGDNQEWIVGSDTQSAIALADPGVSALHASISCESGRWKIVDKMSANGTFVNGNSSTSRYLASGDRIRFGATEAVFLLPAGGTWAEPAASSASGITTGKSGRTWMIAAVAFVLTMVLVFVAFKLMGPHR